MTQRLDSRLIWGSLLIVVGLLFLLQNFGLLNFLGGIGNFTFALLFAAGGGAFLYLLFTNQEHWWAAIPGFALLGLAGTIVFSDLLRLEELGGAVFLGSLGLGFLSVYLLRPLNWWAIIPAGVLGTLALVTLTDQLEGIDGGAVLFFGIGLTFLVLALLPTAKGQLRWAYIPAAVLMLFGLAIGTSFTLLLEYIVPLGLIVGGGYLIARQFWFRR